MSCLLKVDLLLVLVADVLFVRMPLLKAAWEVAKTQHPLEMRKQGSRVGNGRMRKWGPSKHTWPNQDGRKKQPINKTHGKGNRQSVKCKVMHKMPASSPISM
jgi:hypothetical protein